MNIKQLGVERNGTRSAEIRSNQISYSSLIRAIRAIPGTIIVDKAYDFMNDNVKIIIKYHGNLINVDAPFSDYIVNCSDSNEVFDEFIQELSKHKVKWWEHFI